MTGTWQPKKGDPALVAALAGGATIADAAKQAGVAERTVYRRLADPDFRTQVTAARERMVTEAVGLLTQASRAAVTTLSQLLTATSESTRLGAARSIIELGARLREASEFERRLATLEAAAPATQPRRRA